MTYGTTKQQGEPETGESATAGAMPAPQAGGANPTEKSQQKGAPKAEAKLSHELHCQQRSLQEFS